ncbi:LolA family protein [Lihuaxuella thermophila]|uniref:Outer membrane lipoprotein-sorting protein n=1 Tax=Lihuaxuella thermophila TaxID=1173111 RepID=A0A1H8G4Q1_9BACL|nr:outer membrane lipoprotein carrier protein LolA [Lihuaxuella thermophila]SEN38859.1 Outer membrane lipoprotein-sorting protein [Lihuaxuella thermophila]
MRRKAWVLLIILAIATNLAGCGAKGAKEIVSDLSKRSEELESYISHGKMTLYTGEEPLEYEVEVWYKKPHYYRVALKNVKKDIVQILLRNDDGVYVLTPHLKKSFRFQSDWPESSGQVYLYQTLMNSIVDDQKRQFQAGKKEYQFEVAAKYSINQNLTTQRIWLDENLYPKKVDVLNADGEVMVKMEFDRFKAEPSFDKDAFDTQRNLNSLPDESRQTIAKAKGKEPEKEPVQAITPGYIPAGTQLLDEQTIQSPGGPVVIMRYKGKQSFTLTQRHPQEVEASLPVFGKPVELEQTIGVWLELGDKNRLAWTYNGTDFELLGDLPVEEMTQIANSTFDQPIK